MRHLNWLLGGKKKSGDGAPKKPAYATSVSRRIPERPVVNGESGRGCGSPSVRGFNDTLTTMGIFQTASCNNTPSKSGGFDTGGSFITREPTFALNMC